ncbi:polymer-forming cytoskeletal protein [Chryseobacterium sp.]|uniref:bactofilin family protein n=1 Tax=Chryseobacterium sp. TaxID=1871047 RepID=UPI0025B8CB3D|nr:polymer-forming cytoskeletal protein [Chryseobacterium sp.]
MFSNKKENKILNTSSKATNEAITSIVGEDMHITGDIVSNTSVRIDGKISGNVKADKLIIIGNKAQIKGDLNSKKVIVFGHVQGNLNAEEIQLKASGVINGDISVNAVEIEIGGRYNGKLMMNGEQRQINEKNSIKQAAN